MAIFNKGCKILHLLYVCLQESCSTCNSGYKSLSLTIYNNTKEIFCFLSIYYVTRDVVILHHLNFTVQGRYCYFSHFTDDEIDHRHVNNENTGVSLDGVNASLNHGTQCCTFTTHTHTHTHTLGIWDMCLWDKAPLKNAGCIMPLFFLFLQMFFRKIFFHQHTSSEKKRVYQDKSFSIYNHFSVLYP